MLATIREAAPRSRVASSLPASTVGIGAGAAAAGTAAACGWSWAGAGGGRHGGGPVVGEELPPALADRARIGEETVVHVVDQPRVGPEGASRTTELGHGPTLPVAVGPGGGPGSVCPAHELSGRPPRPHAARRRSGAAHRDLRARLARPGRELPAGDAAVARAHLGGLRPAGVPGFTGRRGGRSRRPYRGPAAGRRGRARRPGRSSPSGTAWGATSSSAQRWRRPAPSTPSAPTSRRCRGWGSGATRRRARPWPAVADDPGEEVERFFSRMVSPAAWSRLSEEGRATAAGRRPGAGRRPAEPARRGTARSTSTALERALGVRHGRARRRRRTIAHRGMAGCPRPRRRSSTRSKERSTARTCRTRTTSLRWCAWWWSGRPLRRRKTAGRRRRGPVVVRRGRGASGAATASRRTRPPCPRSSCR